MIGEAGPAVNEWHRGPFYTAEGNVLRSALVYEREIEEVGG
jgi:hypothetical protein